jgi:histidine ammonia-lyase
LIAQKVIFNTYEVIAIEFLAIIQAIDYLKLQDKVSKNTSEYYKNLRAITPVFTKDSVKYKEQAKIISYLKNNLG